MMIVLGGGGFIGRRVIQEAVTCGWRVKALARSDEAAATVAAAGATVIRGEAEHLGPWLHKLEGADSIIDLLQPARPKRVGRRQMRKMSRRRQTYTRALVSALLTVNPQRRPNLISVSGIDDLAPDADGFLSANSELRETELGFNTIGIPVRRIIERSGVKSSFVYLGSVYGPGGPFGHAILPEVGAGKWKNFGTPAERMIVIHVDDVARGLVAISGLDPSRATPKSYVLTDREPVAMASFCGLAASLLGVAAPGTIPKWLAALVAGKPIVETTLRQERARPTLSELPGCSLLYPSYREGLPATLQALGLTPSAHPSTSLPSARRAPGAR